ncbi:MAG TPA: GNAT family N-acetyltransferase [Roseiflexaceae bacterium]|nr:GNAT family N-acetyltransferase [Roseiflexaceae bacterium]
MIETARTIIRPYIEADIALVELIFADPITMMFWPQPFSREAVAAWVRRASASFPATGLGRMLIELRESGAPIGDCGIVEAEINGRREYDLGYIIHHPYWRQGFGVECARACLDYGIHTLGLKRIVANMPHDHIASALVAERLGMRRETTFHNPRNRNILTYLYAIDLGA